MNKILILFSGLCLCLAVPDFAADLDGGAVLPNKRPACNAVVFLEGSKKSDPMGKAVLDQRDKAFSPHVSVVTVGTTVEFPNNDTVFHNVFAYFDAKKFDLGMYPRGASKKVTFEKSGPVTILCNVHSEMSAYIMVVDTPYRAITDKLGKFHISNIPPGTYTLKTWHESGAVSKQSIEIKDKNPNVSIALSRK